MSTRFGIAIPVIAVAVVMFVLGAAAGYAECLRALEGAVSPLVRICR